MPRRAQRNGIQPIHLLQILKMKNNILYKILFLLLVLLLLLPVAQTHFELFEMKPLAGVRLETGDSLKRPQLTWESYKNSSYQKQMDKYLMETVGFREFFIRYYNQYLWSLFSKTYNENVFVGKNRWLYEAVNVRDHYQSLIHDIDFSDERMRKTFDNDAARLYKIQEILKEYGVTLFVALEPGKDYVFPEYLPENKSFFKPNGVHGYDYYKDKFAEIGNNFIDFNALFMQWRDTKDFPVYYKTCTHWSNISAAHAADTLLRYMESRSGLNIPNIAIGKPYYDTPREPDCDLEDLLNLLIPHHAEKYMYADVSVIPDAAAKKPKLIVIGDSFFWNMTYMLPLKDLFTYNHYWYYNNTIYFDGKHKNTGEIDIVKELLDSDFVMIAYCTTQIYNIDRGFIPNALLHLCFDDDEINSKVEEIKESIRNNKELSKSVSEKAAAQRISFEEMLGLDARWLVDNYPENYFEELRGDGVPTKRSRHLLGLVESRK